MRIMPVSNDEQHAKAVALLDKMLDADAAERDRHAAEIDAVVTLVDAYERKRWPLPGKALDPVQVLDYAMSEEVGHTRAELLHIIGSASRVSEILARKRPLTLKMIRALSEAWGIPIECLANDYALETDATRKPSVSASRSSRARAAKGRSRLKVA